MFRRSKKQSGIQVDEKRGHLFLDDVRLLMLRPIDLIEFAEFAGANAEDIIIWVGKSIGKYFVENLFKDEDWSDIMIADKKNAIETILQTLQELGYGLLTPRYEKDKIIIAVDEALSDPERDNFMAKNICMIYQGVFNGVLDALEIEADGNEIQCGLMGDKHCVFEYELLIDEFDEEQVTKEKDKKEDVSSFLSSL